jgi:hypothetical protein
MQHSQQKIFKFKDILFIISKYSNSFPQDNIINYLEKFDLVNQGNYKKLFFQAEKYFSTYHFILTFQVFRQLISIKPEQINKVEKIFSLQCLYYFLINQRINNKQLAYFDIISTLQAISGESNLIIHLQQDQTNNQLAKLINHLHEEENFSSLLVATEPSTDCDTLQSIINLTEKITNNDHFKSKYTQWYFSYILIILWERFDLSQQFFSKNNNAVSSSSAFQLLKNVDHTDYHNILFKHLIYGFDLGKNEAILTQKLLEKFPVQSLPHNKLSKKKEKKLKTFLNISLRDMLMNSL